MAKILGVSTSLRDKSNTLHLVERALESARDSGAEVELLDLRRVPLPLYEAHLDYDKDANVERIIQLADSVDGFIVGSPEYHGCMSGAAKNFFDFLYREIAGKLFGLVAATGGSQGASCFDNMRAAVQYCHGWSLPYNANGSGRDFDSEGKLTNPKVADRVARMGRDMAVYAPILRAQFLADLEQPASQKPGFAQWMA